MTQHTPGPWKVEELFEALRDVARLYCPDSLPHEVVTAIQAARAAIAKAEGD